MKECWSLRLDVQVSHVSWFLVGLEAPGTDCREGLGEAKVFLLLSCPVHPLGLQVHFPRSCQADASCSSFLQATPTPGFWNLCQLPPSLGPSVPAGIAGGSVATQTPVLSSPLLYKAQQIPHPFHVLRWLLCP